jgi:hypothetical protein
MFSNLTLGSTTSPSRSLNPGLVTFLQLSQFMICNNFAGLEPGSGRKTYIAKS